MTMLPEQAITEFQELVYKDTGVLLDKEEATREANLLFNTLDIMFSLDKNKENIAL